MFDLQPSDILSRIILCSDDKDACYHQTCDIPAAIDYKNMAAVVKAIAQGVGTLVSGKEGVEVNSRVFTKNFFVEKNGF